MTRENLHRHLEQLRKELIDSHELDADTRRALIEIAEAIDEVLETDSPDYRKAHKRIENTALTFEARHPRFAGILSEVTDTLAKLGF